MGFYYFDTSALVKRYVTEPGSTWVRELIAYRRFVNDTAHLYPLILVRTDDFHAAARLTQRYPLKAYDAIQLAVALRHYQVLAQHKFNLTFVSGDKQQLMAATVEGLLTDNPFDHLAPLSEGSTP